MLLSYSVFLPERFFLKNQESVLLVNSVRLFLKKIGIAPSVLFGLKLSRVLSGNSPFACKFGYIQYLASSAPFLFIIKEKVSPVTFIQVIILNFIKFIEYKILIYVKNFTHNNIHIIYTT